MKAKKTRTIKMTLQITVLCLFAAAFLLPKGSQSYLMTGIAAAGVLVSLALLIIPPIASGSGNCGFRLGGQWIQETGTRIWKPS